MGNSSEKICKDFTSDSQSLPRLLFHTTCHSDKVYTDGIIAKRVDSFCKGICFANRPVQIGERVQIRLTVVNVNWSGVLRFGFTCRNPDSVNPSTLPRYACPDLTNIQGQYWAKALPERLATQGAIIAFHVNNGGDVIYSVDNTLQGVFFSGVDVSKPLWPLFDIYGNTTVIELVDDRPLNNSTVISTNTPAIPSVHARPNIDQMPIRYHTLASLRPFFWHRKTGKNVTISDDRKTALRVQAEYCNAYVFTTRAMQTGEKLAVQILAIDPAFTGGLTFGLTACNPDDIESCQLPDDADDLLNRPEYWIVNKEVVSKPEAGDELSFFLSPTGEVKFSKNGTNPTTLLHVDINVSFWLFFDMYGCTIALKCLGVQTPSQNSVQQNPNVGITLNSTRFVSSPALPPRPNKENTNDLPQRPPPRRVSSPSSIVPAPPSIPPRPSPRPSSPLNHIPESNCLPPPLIPLSYDIKRHDNNTLNNKNEKTDCADEMADNKENECSVCFEKDVNCVIYKCGHMCTCFDCGMDIKKKSGLCPICREPIADVIVTYRS